MENTSRLFEANGGDLEKEPMPVGVLECPMGTKKVRPRNKAATSSTSSPQILLSRVHEGDLDVLDLQRVDAPREQKKVVDLLWGVRPKA